MDLTAKTVVVTGGSRGIGAATTRALQASGARVVAIARDALALEQLAGGTGAIAWPCDLLDRTALAGLIDGIERDVGAIDVLMKRIVKCQRDPTQHHLPLVLFRAGFIAVADLVWQGVVL